MPPGWFGKKPTEEGSPNPGWLNEEADSDHVAAVSGADEEDNAVGAGRETSPLIAADDEEEEYDEAMEYGNSGYGTGSAHPDDEESNTSPTSSNWHEDDAITTPSRSSSQRSSSSRPKLGTGTKKVSTRTRMNEYKTKLEERRRKMLSGLPRRNCCHGLFIILNIIAVAACLLLILSQVLPIFFVKEQTLLQLTLRGYLTFFCLIFIFAEMELPLPFVRSSQSLHNFISKGFNYSFVSICAMTQAEADLIEESIKKRTMDPMGIDFSWFHALFVEIPAWVMLGVGALYMLLGILCMRPVRDRCREDYARRMEDYFETREALQRSLPPFT
uniref:Transmembrane protein n=1 Tax=Minutocellus polymorphus TaxID=265543 RepID=A0A7S0AVP1_9STRA